MVSKGLNILVLMGSTREGRNGTRVAKFISNAIKASGHKVTVADPLELDLPLLKNPIHFYPDPSQAAKPLHDYQAMVRSADAYVVVTPEYNRNMPPALVNLLNHCPPVDYAFKTSGVVSYSLGPGGGGAVQIPVRSFMVEMGALPIPHMFTIGQVNKVIDEEGACSDDTIEGKASKFFAQLEWFGDAMKKQRDSVDPPISGTMVSA